MAPTSDSRLLAPAITLSTDSCSAVRARAAELLGALGGPEAVSMLEGLAEDSQPSVKAEAVRAMGLLGDWRSTTKLASLLGDSS